MYAIRSYYEYDIAVDRVRGHVTQEIVGEAMKNDLAGLTDQLVSALTSPLSAEEARPTPPDQGYAENPVCGTPEEINRIFYTNGWSNGMPVGLPTSYNFV